MAVTVAKSEGQVVRPLSVLVPLIKKDLEDARAASERAGMPYYQAAGEKMIEAQGQLKRSDFVSWLKRNFDIGIRQAQFYMNYAKSDEAQNESAIRSSSLRDFIRQTSPNHGRTASWKVDVQESKREAERIRTENLTRQQEREADQKLALRLIEIGFKVLAKELHPDRGGSRDAMARLNRVRDRLKQCA